MDARLRVAGGVLLQRALEPSVGLDAISLPSEWACCWASGSHARSGPAHFCWGFHSMVTVSFWYGITAASRRGARLSSSAVMDYGAQSGRESGRVRVLPQVAADHGAGPAGPDGVPHRREHLGIATLPFAPMYQDRAIAGFRHFVKGFRRTRKRRLDRVRASAYRKNNGPIRVNERVCRAGRSTQTS